MKAIDLFSGCGGLSIGFENAGFTIEKAYDNWFEATKVYELNLGHTCEVADLSNEGTIEKIASHNLDLICGGPPCQDFSSAGMRDENLGRSDLTVSFGNIVARARPEWFVMENVERITKSNALQECITTLKNAGYGLTSKTLDASFCGVPQARKRYFLIGHLYSDHNFLDKYLERNQSSKKMTVFDYLGDSLGLEYYYRHPRTYNRRAIFSIYEPSPTVRGVNRPKPKNYKRHKNDPVENVEDIRHLSTKERSLIQTFPRDFVLEGSKSELELMIGNAVPVKLAEFVANSITDYKNNFLKKESQTGSSQIQLNFNF